ncbi:MAG: CsgG/HfaB family protein [Desulfobulbaceae bacterium]|nr:CsgG/HfaB family protein [Desulfobulbaceae bacterium]
MTARNSLITFIISVILIAGCAEQQSHYVRNGKEYGTTSGSFRGRWWNYYQRGRSFSDGNFYREAISDFEKAIDGREKDQWRARTYGMHFVDYFPHRELGIVYYHLKEYNKAIAELENSVENAPSAKGHYFLNKARSAKIKNESLDRSAPELNLQASTIQEITKNFTKVIEGVASDDTYIAQIMVGDHQVPLELAERTKIFNAEVPLAEGENSIKVTATDLAGKSTEKYLNIYSDRRGPQIEIENFISQNNQATLIGNVSDDQQLASLEINSRPWPIKGFPPDHNFKVTVPEGKVTIVATDRVGNVTRAIVRSDELSLKRKNYLRLATLDMSVLANNNSQVVSDASITFLASTQSGLNDTDPPYIRIENLGAEEETYEDMVLIEGLVSDNSFLIYVTINGDPILNKKGKRIFFSQLKKLDEGMNEFLIVAADEHGNKISRTIKVTRKIQQIKQIGSRMSIAILPFDQQGNGSYQGEIIHDQLLDSFIEQARFKIVERKKIESILRELKLSSTDLVDPDEAAKLGKIVAAQSMLAGTVIEAPDSVEIIGRLIDTETSTILASNDIFGEEKGLAALNNMLDSLAYKFKRDFPLVEGILVEVRDGTVLIDAGTEKQLKPNTRFICYREGQPIKHPVTGKLLGAEPQILGRLKVEEVYEGFSRAQVVDQENSFVVSDKVIAQ